MEIAEIVTYSVVAIVFVLVMLQSIRIMVNGETGVEHIPPPPPAPSSDSHLTEGYNLDVNWWESYVVPTYTAIAAREEEG